jgi:hypothetical protein
MEELNITEPQADVQADVQVEQTPTGDNVTSYFNDVIKPSGDFTTESEFREFLSDKGQAESYFKEVVGPAGDFGSFEEFSSFLNIGDVGKQMPPVQTNIGGQEKESSKQDGFGLALQNLQKVTGRTIFPSDLTGGQLKQLSKQYNLPSFALNDQQYDELAKKLRGKSFFQAQIETAKTLPNKVEARKMTRSAYKGIKSELAAQQQLLENDINQVQQNIGQYEKQLSDLKSVFEDVNQPQEVRQAASQDFINIRNQANDLISQSQPAIDEYNQNQKTLASLGRLTEPTEAAKQINNGLDAYIAANPYSPLNNPVVKGISNAIVPSFLNTAGAIIDNPIMRMAYTDSGKLAADALSNTLFDAAKAVTITPTAKEEKSVFDEITPENVQYTIGNLLGYIIPSATGAGLVSKAAAPITSQLITGGQVYGNYYKEGLDAGLSRNEAALFASVPTIVTAYLGDKGVEMMLAGFSKQGVKSIIREAAKSSIGKSPSEIMKIAGSASKGFLEGVLKEGSQEGVEQLSEMVSKDVANNFAEAKFEGNFSIDGYLRGVAEAATLGAAVGGPLGSVSGIASRRNIADVAAESLVNPDEEFTFKKTLQSLLQDGDIDQNQFDVISNQFEVAKLAAQKIPNQVTDSDLRTEATELIQEKEALNAEIATKDPAMTTSLKNRVAEIDKRLGEISEGKAIPVEEEQVVPTETELITQQETIKTKEDAVQEQTAGQVPVQSEAGAGEAMAQGESQAEPQVAAEAGQVEATTEKKKIDESIVEYSPSEETKDKDMVVLSNILAKNKIIPPAEPEITDFGDVVTFEYYDQESESPIVTRITLKRNADGTLTTKNSKVEKQVPPIRQTTFFKNYISERAPQVTKEEEKLIVTRVSDEEMSAGNQEMDSANVGETITTTKPSRIYKGTFGKRNPDGSIRSAHPDVIGSFGSTDRNIAIKYKGNESFKAFDIPAGTTIEVVKTPKFGEGISIARQDETDRINNSTAQIVRLDTIDNGGKQSQYIIKDKSLIDNGYLVDEAAVSEELQVQEEPPILEPTIIPPSFGVELEEGARQRVNSIYERMALKAEEKAKEEPERSEEYLRVAEEIRKRGLYNQRTTEQTKQDGDLLISTFDDIEAAAEFVMNNPINGAIRTYVLGQRMTRAKEAAILNRTAENLALRDQAIYDFAAYSTDVGQAVNEIKNVEADNADLFYIGRFAEYIAKLADNLGNPAVTTTNASKVVKAAKEVVKLRQDILNQVANVISGMADNATIDNLMIDALGMDKAGKNRVLTNRMRSGLRKIAGSVESKKIIGEKLKQLSNLGVFGLAETREEVKELIQRGLAEINPTLQTGLDTAEIQEMAEMFMIIYEEMATQRMEDLLDKAFNGNNKNNAAVIKAVMYGALDTPNALNKFAQKFGLSTITPQMQQQLRNAAQQVANARGNTARSIAQAAFTSMFNRFIYQANPNGYKILTSLRAFFGYFENVFYNTALFSINTFARAAQGNTLRTFGNILNAVARGDFQIIADSFRDVYKKRETTFNYTDRNGNIRTIDAKTRLALDDMYSSLRGLPRLAEVKRSGGLNEVEIAIRNTDSRLKRRFLRALAVPASRVMGAIDASVMPLNMFLTKRQAFHDVLKAFYKDKGINISEAQLRTQLNDILGVESTYVSKAMEQAVVDVMGSKLWTDLGFTNADEFPTSDPRKKAPLSKEAKIYNEFLFRTREILDSEENKRLQDSFSKTGYSGLISPTESDLMAAAIDNYAIRVSSELAFLGTPRGSLQTPAESINKLSQKYLPLKYAGLAPLFTNAAFNAAGMAIRVTPGLNAIQYFKYIRTGTRGGYSKDAKKEFGSDYEALTKIDQNKMLRTVVLTNAAFIIAATFKPYDDKEEEKKAIDNKTWTGSTPLRLTKAQTDLGYLPGRIYINGEGYDYRDNPLALLISSISFVRNYGLWSFDTRSRNFYAEDDGEIGYDPNFIEAAGAYGLFVTSSLLELSTIKDMSKTYSDLIEILNPPKGEDDAKQGQLVERFLERKGANFIKTTIPYSRFTAEIKTIYDAINDEEKKLPLTFYDNIVFGSAIEDNVIKTNGYDFFGRPVKDAFTLILPFASSTSVGEDPKVDKEHRLFRKMNYNPKLLLNDHLPVHVTLDDLNGDENRFENYFKNIKKLEKEGDIVKDVERKSMSDKRVLVSLAMTREEANLANQKSTEFAGKFIERNFNKLQDMEMSRFKEAMDMIYSIGREVAIYQNFDKLIEYDKADYYQMIDSKIKKFKDKFVGSEQDNLSWPTMFEPSNLIGDSFMTSPKVKL